MAAPFQSERLRKLSKPLRPSAEKLKVFFPELKWNLKKANYDIDPVVFLSVSLYLAFVVFFLSCLGIVLPLYLSGQEIWIYSLVAPFVLAAIAFLYTLLIPKVKIVKEEEKINHDLEYMLRDLRIQIRSGQTLFQSMENIANGGYGECSRVAQRVVKEVQTGSSMREVLNDEATVTPSDYMERSLWQISDAIQTGSNIEDALLGICNDMREEKENKIKSYGQELAMWGLVYMMVAIVVPSMGIVLLLIISSIMGKAAIDYQTLWVIFAFVVLIQIIFLQLIKSKRPSVG